MAGGREFDRGKLKELVLYLSERSADDPGFGMVKLNKLLYRADFEAYRLLGKSITGAEYEKQAYGPVARALPVVLDDLAANQYVIWRHFAAGDYTRDVPAATVPPDLHAFSPDEIEIVDRALQELADHGGKSVSEWSHETSAGWRVKKIGQEIPYSSAIINLKPPSKEAMARVRAQLASRFS